MVNTANYIKFNRLAWAGHWYVWIKTELYKKYSAPNQMEYQELEDRNCNGKMAFIKTGEY